MSISLIAFGAYLANLVIIFTRLAMTLDRLFVLVHTTDMPLWKKPFDGLFWSRLVKLVADCINSVFCAAISVILAPGVAGSALGGTASLMVSIFIIGLPSLHRHAKRRAQRA